MKAYSSAVIDAKTWEKPFVTGFSVEPDIICFVSDKDRCRGPVCAAVYRFLSGRDEGDAPRPAAFSCGISACDGDDIPELTLDVLREAGYAKADEKVRIRARKAERLLIENCRYAVAADDSVAMRLMFDFPESASKIRCFCEEIRPAESETIDEYRRVLRDAEDRLRKMFCFDNER